MAYERFNAKNSALLLIDHQVGTINWMNSAPHDEVKRNTIALAKGAKAAGMEVILTSSMEDQAQGPLFPELEEILPVRFHNRIKRTGVVDAFDDPNFKRVVKATGKTNLIMAGLLTEVCVVYPALNAFDEGYEVQVVADASGSATKENDNLALDRMRQSGITVVSTIQILSEMVDNWVEAPGPDIMAILAGLYEELK